MSKAVSKATEGSAVAFNSDGRPTVAGPPQRTRANF